MAPYLHNLSNHQQDNLLRQFILHERSLTPPAKCLECSNKACKNCLILQSHKSYAAYMAYKRMYDSMELVEVDGQNKVQCSYE